MKVSIKTLSQSKLVLISIEIKILLCRFFPSFLLSQQNTDKPVYLPKHIYKFVNGRGNQVGNYEFSWKLPKLKKTYDHGIEIPNLWKRHQFPTSTQYGRQLPT